MVDDESSKDPKVVEFTVGIESIESTSLHVRHIELPEGQGVAVSLRPTEAFFKATANMSARELAENVKRIYRGQPLGTGQPLQLAHTLEAVLDAMTSTDDESVRMGFASHFLGSIEAVAGSDERSRAAAKTMLARDLRHACIDLSARLKLTSAPPQSDTDAMREDDGHLWLDRPFADALALLGPVGGELAGRFMANTSHDADDPKSTWAGWLDEHSRGGLGLGVLRCRWLELLTTALWNDQTGERWRNRADRQPAVVRAVAEPFAIMTTRQGQLFDDRQIRDDRGKVIGSIPEHDMAVIHQTREGLDLFGRVWAQRGFDELVRRAFDNYDGGLRRFHEVTFNGGWGALAEAIGFNTKNGYGDLRKYLLAGQTIQIHDGGTQWGGLWTWKHEKAAPGRQSQLIIALGDAMLPDYVFSDRFKGDSNNRRKAKRLVPVLRHDPPHKMVGVRARGAVYTLSRFALIELRDRAHEMDQDHAIVTTRDRWRRLAHKAGLNPKHVEVVLDGWESGDGDAPSLMKRDGDRWTLADDHSLERDFIASAGERSRAARKRGKKGAKVRAKNRSKKAAKK